MPLYALPVSISDLTQLQLGIEFSIDPTDATAEAGLINQSQPAATVNSYAQQLLASNISLSQVAMAVDSLMFGVTDNVTELANLSTQFLPPQVASALNFGLNPTVYAAEALGLALAGGNNNFSNHFGTLSVDQFASEVGSITGVNTGAIQGFVQSWISFYTANPSAIFGMPVTLAAYGAAFGDAVGAALLNPTVNGTLALLAGEVQNALIDNAEGLYQPGIPLIAEPPHIPLQGEALPIPNAGGAPYGPTIDWAAQFGAYSYAQFVAPKQSAINVAINNAPSNFTLDTQHYGDGDLEIKAAGGHGNLFTLILGDSSASDFLGTVVVEGYSTTEVVVAPGPGSDTVALTSNSTNAVISGSGSLTLDFVEPPTITDIGVSLTISDVDEARKIDASNAPLLVMSSPALDVQPSGVTILGGTGPGNVLQGAVGDQFGFPITFSNSSTGLTFSQVQADNLTGGASGGDTIFGDGGADTITLPAHTQPDFLVFGEELFRQQAKPIAITDGFDRAYLGFWGANAAPITGQSIAGTSDAIGFPTPIPIPNLFPGQNTGGTSADMTTVTGFHAGSGGDILQFKAAAWNGDSAAFAGLSTQGDLVVLNGIFVVAPGAAQLSSPWLNGGSNNLLNAADNVLRYAPADASLQNAQQLAAQLHSFSNAVVLPGDGLISPSDGRHILVAYDASSNVNGTIQHAVNIADVDLVNISADNQSSTANLNVYASDMVHLVGVSLTSLVADNIHFI